MKLEADGPIVRPKVRSLICGEVIGDYKTAGLNTAKLDEALHHLDSDNAGETDDDPNQNPQDPVVRRLLRASALLFMGLHQGTRIGKRPRKRRAG